MKKLISTCTIVISLLALAYAPDTLARSFSDLGCGTNYGPNQKVAPVYPQRAQQRGIEGYIVMGFTITTDGKVRDVSVVDAQPTNTFVRSATRAVRSMQFPPCIVNGQVTEQASVSVRYEFKLKR